MNEERGRRARTSYTKPTQYKHKHNYKRSVAEDDNWAWSNASFTLLMNDDILAAARGIFLYLAAAHKHESLDLVGGVIGAVLLLWAGQLSYRYFTGERSRRGL